MAVLFSVYYRVRSMMPLPFRRYAEWLRPIVCPLMRGAMQQAKLISTLMPCFCIIAIPFVMNPDFAVHFRPDLMLSDSALKF
jgi:hypothetical protein